MGSPSHTEPTPPQVVIGLAPWSQLRPPILDRLLLATDGSAAATAAAQVTAALARKSGKPPDVLTVLPIPGGLRTRSDHHAPPDDVVDDGETRTLRLLEVQRSLRASIPESRGWTVELRVGAPAATIAAEATHRRSTLIVLGLRPHSTSDPMLLGDTSHRVVHDTPMPVLAVTTALRGCPRRVAVAVDFSRASIAAAEAACALVAPGGTVYLVHTSLGGGALYGGTRSGTAGDHDGSRATHHDEEVILALSRLQRLLKVPASVRTIPIRLPASTGAGAFSEFGRRAEIELLAIGRQPWPLLERMATEHVLGPLMHAAGCSVLLIPPVTRAVTA